MCHILDNRLLLVIMKEKVKEPMGAFEPNASTVLES